MPQSGQDDGESCLPHLCRLICSPWSSEIETIAPDEVRVLAVPLENVPIPETQLLSYLTEEERGRADRFRVAKARIQFVSTRGLLRLTLSKILVVAPEKVPIGYSGVGKPVLLDNSDHLHFNVTHTEGLALIALARRVIGIDVERIRPIENTEGLVVRFFSKAERDTYLSLETAKRLAGFFHGWTCKEALIKAAGLSVAYLDAFDVELNPDKPAKLLAARNAGLSGMDWCLAGFEPMEGYAAAVAVAGVRELALEPACKNMRPA
jgi:4'-phosphopantetheinyl transferase